MTKVRVSKKEMMKILTLVLAVGKAPEVFLLEGEVVEKCQCHLGGGYCSTIYHCSCDCHKKVEETMEELIGRVRKENPCARESLPPLPSEMPPMIHNYLEVAGKVNEVIRYLKAKENQ